MDNDPESGASRLPDTLTSGHLWLLRGHLTLCHLIAAAVPTKIDGHCRRATKKVIVDDHQAQGITSVHPICADMRHQFGFEGEAASTL